MPVAANTNDYVRRFADRIEQRLSEADRRDEHVTVLNMAPGEPGGVGAFLGAITSAPPATFATLLVVPVLELGAEPVRSLRKLCGEQGLDPVFAGLVPGDDGRESTQAIAVLCPSLADVIGPAPDSFRLTAMVTAFNEADVIRPTVQYLLDQGIDVVVIDNWSTDSTMDEIADLVDGARVSVLKFPEDGPSGLYEWERMLEFVATAAAKVDSDWIVHHDADQRHEAPWPGASYRDAIYAVDRLGFNAIDHTVIDFRPVNDDFVDGTELRDHFHYFEFDRGAAASTHVQAWRNDGPVDLASSGGHAVKFADRKVFPFNFLLRHYQIRSQAHGERKVFRDRRPRYQIDELDRGWHEHYLSMSKRHSFIRKASDLNEFRPEDFGEHYLLQMVAQVGIIEAEPAHRRFGPLRDAALNVLRSTGTLRAAVRARNRILAGRR
ncbi:MAG: glycosyltransferase family 2 protein [Acidimicrobiales bacterium]